MDRVTPGPSRSFTLQDQLAFAQASGDYNPLHVDALVDAGDVNLDNLDSIERILAYVAQVSA